MNTVTIDIEADNSRDALVVTAKSPVGCYLSELTRTLVKRVCQEIDSCCDEVSCGDGRVYRLRVDVALKSENLLPAVLTVVKQFHSFGWDVRVS